jgi:hypothetical protein
VVQEKYGTEFASATDRRGPNTTDDDSTKESSEFHGNDGTEFCYN